MLVVVAVDQILEALAGLEAMAVVVLEVVILGLMQERQAQQILAVAAVVLAQ